MTKPSNIIKTFPSVPFGDLVFCPMNGVTYQEDMSLSVEYASDYFNKYVEYEDSDISLKLNGFRTEITQKYCDVLLDIGVGSGEFIKKSNIKVYGYDINPVAQEWLKSEDLFLNPYENIPEEVQGLSFWDVLEHFKNPQDILDIIPSGVYVFVSIPIIDDLIYVRYSKHYRPNEHYYYFTKNGFMSYMSLLDYSLIEDNDNETKAGREEIHTFVFRKN